MNGAKPVNPPDQPALPLAEGGGPAVGPGLGTLLQGRRAGGSPGAPRSGDTSASLPPAMRQSGLLRWTLLAADALLILLAAWLVFGRAQRLGVWEILLCVLALGIAACLGCWAVLLAGKK